MFEQYVNKAPNVMEAHFSFLYPGLHSANKVVTTEKGIPLCFVLFVLQ